MNQSPIILAIALLFCPGLAMPQSPDPSIDLRTEWKIKKDTDYQPWKGEPVKAVYFSLDGSGLRGATLIVRDDERFAIFLNQLLIVTRERGEVRLSVDSLSRLYSDKLMIGVFQAGGVSSLATRIQLPPETTVEADDSLLPRKGSYFLDFSLTVTLILLVYLMVLMSTNSRVTLDYINSFRLFFLREREESLATNRVTSRVNLLFYLFCCSFCSLTLLVAFHLSGDLIPVSHYFPIRTTGEGFLQWFKLTAILSGLLALKMAVVFLTALLFHIKEAAVMQFFQFVRSLFLATFLIALVSLINFVLNGGSGGVHPVLLKIGAGILVLSAVMLYLKLLGITRYHFFHLFSYLCASEIIPLVIILKILLY